MRVQIFLIISMLLLAVLAGPGCSREKVPAGFVGVKVHLYGDSKGVDNAEVPPGRYWIGWNEDLYSFPTFTQNYTWTRSVDEGSPVNESLTFQTVEGLSVNADIGIRYRIDPSRVSDIFEKYRKGVDEITNVDLRNMVRDAFNAHASTEPIESVYGSGKRDLLASVQDDITKQCSEFGIIIEKISLIGEFRLPGRVKESINQKIQATQRAQQRQNEVAESIAQANKLRAIAKGEADALLTRAEAEAKANRVVAESISPALIQYRSVTKWNGTLPQVTGGAIPMISLDTDQ
jgi:regulator of protease activity HflC (stomatin/prohibitin superfamily)